MEKKDFKFYMKLSVAVTILINGLLTVTFKVHPKYLVIFAAVLIVLSVIDYLKKD